MAIRNFKLNLEYDGTDFHGWQKQPDLRTVQGTLEETIEVVFGHSVQVNGAGRTDAGVHALGQVSNFVMDTKLSPQQVGKAITSKLPGDIQIYRVEEVDMKFHARFSAKSRRYTYYLRTEPTAIWRRFAYVVAMDLDVSRMQEAAGTLVGEHDFTSFTPTRSAGVPTACNVLESSVRQDDEIVSFTIEADHFLHNMVRVLVGTLVDVGRGRIGPEQMADIMCKKERGAAGPTIPPNGLFLIHVCYDE